MQKVTLTQVLLAREQRVQKQKELLTRHQSTLVCFTMNIAGPEKTSPAISRGFVLGCSRLEAQLKGSGISILHKETRCAAAGWEAFYLTGGTAEQVKALCAEIEEADSLGRLFDMDVFTSDGRKVQREELGLPGRTCLICGGPVHICSRSRSHSAAQLQLRTNSILEDALQTRDREHIAHLAVKALLFEVAVAPKPGLVDKTGPGSHADMDIFTFLGSSSVLQPYFLKCVRTGQETTALPPTQTFARLRYHGKLAEYTMYEETGGVNTHKGAIFSMGLFCAAAGRLDQADRTPEAILALCAEMTRGLVEEMREDCANTQGRRLYRAHGITGIRGQAQAGFPLVGQVGLPILRQGLARGLSLNDAAAIALLHILTQAQDTNLICRSGIGVWQETLCYVKRFLAQDPFPTPEKIRTLQPYFLQHRLSPGGSADLLALSLFLHFLCP